MTVVGVIGTGNMGAALVKGWLRAAPEGIGFVVWDKIQAAATRLLVDDRVRVAASLDDLVAQADVVLVVVKPKDAPDLLQAIRPSLSDRHTVISSMAGVTLDIAAGDDRAGPHALSHHAQPGRRAQRGRGGGGRGAGRGSGGAPGDPGAASSRSVSRRCSPRR